MKSRAIVVGAVTLAVAVCLPAASSADVLIVKSETLPQYDAPASAFRSATGHETFEVSIAGSREEGERRLRKAVAGRDIDAVYALGARASYLARVVLPDSPLVFSMVVDWHRYDLDRGATTGVALEMPVDALFTRFKLMLDGLDTVGVVYSKSTAPALIADARAAAELLGIELVEEEVANGDEVAGAYRRMRTEIDALWMVPDPVVVTRDNFAYLTDRCRNDGVSFLAFSENFVRAGALLSVAPSYETMGAQAAVLLEKLLAAPDSPPDVQSPVGSNLVVNARTAAALGFDLNATTIGMADVIVDLASAGEVEAR